MADILSKEEIDALLDVVDAADAGWHVDNYPFWSLTKFAGIFEVKKFTRESMDNLLKTLNVYRIESDSDHELYNYNHATCNSSIDHITRTLKSVNYHLVLIGSSEKNITSRLREEQIQREFLKGVDSCIDDWVEDHPQHLI